MGARSFLGARGGGGARCFLGPGGGGGQGASWGAQQAVGGLAMSGEKVVMDFQECKVFGVRTRGWVGGHSTSSCQSKNASMQR